MPPGIRRTKHGWQVYTTLGGHFRSQHFPPTTREIDLRRARDELRARARLKLPEPHAATTRTFRQDCDDYLAAIGGMASFSDRAYRVNLWCATLGPGRDRHTITAVEIRQQLEKWRTAGAAHGTLNLRLTAIRQIWTVLDGPAAPNPGRNVPKYRETPPALRLPPWKDAERVVAHVGTTTRHGDRSRARLTALLWTGWPASTLKRLTAADIDFRRKVAHLQGRRKGGGTRARTVPLTPQAIDALRNLKKLDAFGAFSNSALHSCLHRACDALEVRRFSVYTLRHLFLTTLTLASGDERGVSELALHTDARQTRRYTEHAASARAREVLARLARF